MPKPSGTSKERLYKKGQEKKISVAENTEKRKDYSGKSQELRETLLTLKKQGTN